MIVTLAEAAAAMGYAPTTLSTTGIAKVVISEGQARDKDETISEWVNGGFFHMLNPFEIADELFAALVIGCLILAFVCASSLVDYHEKINDEAFEARAERLGYKKADASKPQAKGTALARLSVASETIMSMDTENGHGSPWRPGEPHERGAWTTDINFDLPILRYVIIGTVLAGIFLGLKLLLNQPIILDDYLLAFGMFAFFVAMPLLRRFYLYRKRTRESGR